jgi:hypothetical protein
VGALPARRLSSPERRARGARKPREVGRADRVADAEPVGADVEDAVAEVVRSREWLAAALAQIHAEAPSGSSYPGTEPMAAGTLSTFSLITFPEGPASGVIPCGRGPAASSARRVECRRL